LTGPSSTTLFFHALADTGSRCRRPD
jgi:hypothetical protein